VFDRQIECARLLGIGKPDGRELAVGFGLARHEFEPGVSRQVKELFQIAAGHSVQGRRDDLQIGRERGMPPVLQDLRVVALEDRLVDYTDSLVRERRIADPVDRGGDLSVQRRNDLRCAVRVDLVAVVLGRVVTGRHDHRGGRPEFALQPGDDRGGGRRTPPMHSNPGAGKDAGRILGELFRHAPRVTAHDDSPFPDR
jgi:hypothetical protein